MIVNVVQSTTRSNHQDHSFLYTENYSFSLLRQQFYVHYQDNEILILLEVDVDFYVLDDISYMYNQECAFSTWSLFGRNQSETRQALVVS